MSDDNKYVKYVEYKPGEVLEPGAYVYVGHDDRDGYRKHNATFGIEARCFHYPIFKRVDPLQDVNDLYDQANKALLEAKEGHLKFLKEHAAFKPGNYIEYGHHNYTARVMGYRLDRGTLESPWYRAIDVHGFEKSVGTDIDKPRLFPRDNPKLLDDE